MPEEEKKKPWMTRERQILLVAGVLGLLVVIFLLSRYPIAIPNNLIYLAVIGGVGYAAYQHYFGRKARFDMYSVINKIRTDEYAHSGLILDTSEKNVAVDRTGVNEYAVMFRNEMLTFRYDGDTGTMGKLPFHISDVKDDIEKSEIARTYAKEKIAEAKGKETLKKLGFESE